VPELEYVAEADKIVRGVPQQYGGGRGREGQHRANGRPNAVDLRLFLPQAAVEHAQKNGGVYQLEGAAAYGQRETDKGGVPVPPVL